MRWEILLERRTKNRLNPEITQRKLRSIAKLAEDKPSLKCDGHVSKLREPKKIIDQETHEELYLYSARIVVQSTLMAPAADVDESFRRHLFEPIKGYAKSEGWDVLSDLSVTTDSISGIVNQNLYSHQVADYSESEAQREMFELPKLDDNAYEQFFNGVYEREAHIRMIHDSMLAYARSNGEQRSHILLEGRPACCKTILFERFKAFYENDAPEGVERVAFIDGPTMSKAGLENWMLTAAMSNKLPEVICVEEIEKQNMDNLLTLLSVMGSGYIMKTNAKIGRMKKMAKCVIWATCNDKQLLRKFRDGALWSRFIHKFHCRRPGRELMSRIVHDKVLKTNGDPRWADAAINFCYDDVIKITGKPIVDPRAIIGLLDGGDRLLDGSYQLDYIETLSREDDVNEDEQDEPAISALAKEQQISSDSSRRSTNSKAL